MLFYVSQFQRRKKEGKEEKKRKRGKEEKRKSKIEKEKKKKINERGHEVSDSRTKNIGRVTSEVNEKRKKWI